MLLLSVLLNREIFLIFVSVWAKKWHPKRAWDIRKNHTWDFRTPSFLRVTRSCARIVIFRDKRDEKRRFGVGNAVSTELNRMYRVTYLESLDSMEQAQNPEKRNKSCEDTRPGTLPQTCPNSDFIERDTSIVDESFIYVQVVYILRNSHYRHRFTGPLRVRNKNLLRC